MDFMQNVKIVLKENKTHMQGFIQKEWQNQEKSIITVIGKKFLKIKKIIAR